MHSFIGMKERSSAYGAPQASGWTAWPPPITRGYLGLWYHSPVHKRRVTRRGPWTESADALTLERVGRAVTEEAARVGLVCGLVRARDADSRRGVAVGFLHEEGFALVLGGANARHVHLITTARVGRQRSSQTGNGVYARRPNRPSTGSSTGSQSLPSRRRGPCPPT